MALDGGVGSADVDAPEVEGGVEVVPLVVDPVVPVEEVDVIPAPVEEVGVVEDVVAPDVEPEAEPLDVPFVAAEAVLVERREFAAPPPQAVRKIRQDEKPAESRMRLTLVLRY